MILVEFLIFLAVVVYMLKDSIRRKNCPHDQGVNETQACDAICKQCGKNLGFISSKENQVRRRQ